MRQQMLTQSSTVDTDTDGVQFGLNTVRTSAMTFSSEKIFEWVISQIPSGARVLNACAGETKLEEAGDNISVVRNDINTDRDADLHVDVANIADHLPANSFDYIIHDPPFSASESDGTYEGEQTRYGEETISQFRRLLKPGGKLMIWGYSPHSYPEFEVSRVHLWNRWGEEKITIRLSSRMLLTRNHRQLSTLHRQFRSTR